MNSIVVIGSSGHARVILDIVEYQARYKIAGLIDRFRAIGETTLGYPVLGAEEDLPGLAHRLALAGVIVAIGDNWVRAQVIDTIAQLCPALPLVSAIHPSACVGRGAEIGPGSVVMPGSVISPCAVVGTGCIVNTLASLDHDACMDDFSSLAPRAATGGNCRIGAYSAIGIGAVLKHGVTIGEHTVIGAGATVVQDVSSYCVAYGTPARVVRPRAAGERYL